jgi:alanine racemase
MTAPWIELKASALRHNVDVFRKVLGPARLGAVLKANAYGHGLAEVLSVVHDHVDAAYVISADDAFRLRKLAGETKQVIVIGAVTPDEVVELARHRCEVVLADDGWPAAVTALREEHLRARVHLHLDTGLGREGFTPPELPALAEQLKAVTDTLQIVGVLSHFSNTEDVTEQGYALSQVEAFESGYEYLRTALELPPTTQRHLAASAAALVLPKARYDIARIGIALYGLWPSTETRLSARLVLNEVPQLEPVLSWKCRSQAVKTLPAGAFVGYGCTYRCSRETKVAVLPVGYFDGYPRLLSSRAHVLVNGTRCPVLGRVMMNHIVVDISGAGVEGSSVVATLLGTDGAEQVSAEMLATWAQTINYEIVARLGAHLRRVVV